MESKLFAFRVAQPVETIPVEFRYDPQSQTSVWTGDSEALARATCTGGVLGGAADCYQSGSYCSTSGGATVGWECD
ncbi:MAG: hypothetical protein J2P25_00335 [Nocardiopsaceae bacterium]|nr:hypothetical protein [Nocardiopsaceae bacterium]